MTGYGLCDRYQDDWLKTSANSLQLWEKAPFEPYAQQKHVISSKPFLINFKITIYMYLSMHFFPNDKNVENRFHAATTLAYNNSLIVHYLLQMTYYVICPDIDPLTSAAADFFQQLGTG